MTRRVAFVCFAVGGLVASGSRDVAAAAPPQGLEAAAGVLKTSKNPKERLQAVRSLEKVADPKAIAVLIEALRALNPGSPQDDWFVRRAASKALALKGQPAIDPLLKAAADKDPLVRNRALAALTMMHAPGVRDILVKALKADPDWEVRLECVLQLRDLGDKAAVPALKIAAKEDAHEQVRARATKIAARLETEGK